MLMWLIFGFYQSFLLCIIGFALNNDKTNNYFHARQFWLVISLCLITGLSSVYIGVYGAFLMIITTFLVIFRRNNNILRSIGITAHATIILILSDHLVSTTRTYIGFKNNLQGSFSGLFLHCISFSLIAVLLTSLSSFFFSQFQASKQIDLRENRIFILANFFTLIIYYCSIIMGSFLGNTSDLIQMNFFFFLLYLCLSIIAFSFYYRAMKAKVEMIKKESDYQALMEYTESMENQYKEVRKFRHDFQNILNSLDDYVLSEDFSGLKNYYLNEIKPTSEEISEMNFKLTELQNIKQREIKSVLALKLMTAQNIEIEVNLEVKEVIEDIPLDAIVLVRVLGILLDNAIEAIEELAIGKLTVAVFK
ncbi:MAG TPA: hypothetical protein DEQ24_08010, partial [Enterococcus sp.]|nr:hypothetical protein [Enterococcus sp.]